MLDSTNTWLLRFSLSTQQIKTKVIHGTLAMTASRLTCLRQVYSCWEWWLAKTSKVKTRRTNSFTNRLVPKRFKISGQNWTLINPQKVKAMRNIPKNLWNLLKVCWSTTQARGLTWNQYLLTPGWSFSVKETKARTPSSREPLRSKLKDSNALSKQESKPETRSKRSKPLLQSNPKFEIKINTMTDKTLTLIKKISKKLIKIS